MFVLRRICTCSFMLFLSCIHINRLVDGRMCLILRYKSSWGWTLGCSKHVEDTINKLKRSCKKVCILFLLHRYVTTRGSANVMFRTLVNCYRLQPLTCVNPDLRETVRQKVNKARRWMLRQNSDCNCRPLYQISYLLCSSTLDSSFTPRR